MWCRELFAGMLLAATVGACAVVDPVDPRYDTVNRSLAKARTNPFSSISFVPVTTGR
jgi:hypothetical protein